MLHLGRIFQSCQILLQQDSSVQVVLGQSHCSVQSFRGLLVAVHRALPWEGGSLSSRAQTVAKTGNVADLLITTLWTWSVYGICRILLRQHIFNLLVYLLAFIIILLCRIRSYTRALIKNFYLSIIHRPCSVCL